MEKKWVEWALAAAVAWVVPWLMLGLMGPGPEAPEEAAPVTAPREERIWVLLDGEPVEMALDFYLTGVLLGEMPKSFHEEAKMAQAVVARTYALRTAARGAKHPGFVCTNSGCCQSWQDPEAFPDTEAVAMAREAVEATAGLVLCYGGELIEATYFSCSGGRTEDAVAVWGSDVPYLQSVESPGEEMAAHFRDTAVFSLEAVREKLGLSGKPVFRNWRYTEGGGVAAVEVSGKEFTGTELRRLLGLRSAAFTVEVVGQEVRFHTAGYGHRVGMSQYGAQAMAEKGADFREILEHYYPGTEMVGS